MEQLLLSGKDGWRVPWRRLSVGEARPTAHLHQHLLQLPKLVHVNQCYIPGIVTAHTAILLGSLHMFLQCNGKRNVGSPALTHFTLRGGSGS